MSKCPYCKQPLKGKMRLPPISDRQKTIYRAVAKSGTKGVKTDALARLIGSYGRGGAIVVRVQIHELNKALAKIGQKIHAALGAYRLDRVG